MAKDEPSRNSLWQFARFIVLSATWLCLAAFSVFQTLELGIVKGDFAHNSAKIPLYYRMLEKTCVTIDQLESEVVTSGWRSERRSAPYNDSLLNDSHPRALLVYIEPPIPFAIVDWVGYQFDESGCMTSK